MAALAEAAYADLAIPDVQGTFRFTVGRLPEAEGDAILLRIVWSSLLSNAVKYTLPMSERIIVVDGAREGAQVTYSVKDSGVGFDPAHASKLFGVFQRLHGQEEFEGTGIGLAIVKRIVERHGGRVRAEAARKAGATFFFSLPSGGGANA
jgi:light-regulated signal transduction histidine kinase (bacteriophytochrome)